MPERGRDAAAIAGGFFGFAKFEVPLAGVGGLDGVHAGSQTGFFQEESPAFVSVRRALTVLIFAHGQFRVLPAMDYFHHSSGHVGAHVVADQHVGRF